MGIYDPPPIGAWPRDLGLEAPCTVCYENQRREYRAWDHDYYAWGLRAVLRGARICIDCYKEALREMNLEQHKLKNTLIQLKRAVRGDAMTLFRSGKFTLHSGESSEFIIDCRSFTSEDLKTLAKIGSRLVGPFGSVEGVPKGGLPFAEAMWEHLDPRSDRLLIVDDVYTTGTSMNEHRSGREAAGLVIFARRIPPPWIEPIFHLNQGLRRG